MERHMKKGFTVLELLVAISVTALLAAMLFNITTQVSKTQAQSSADLETNQVAQYILDRIQEDLQCAIYQNDGNLWMAATILTRVDERPGISYDSWSNKFLEKPKPEELSLRINQTHFQSQNVPMTPNAQANKQGKIEESRFGVRGVWLRFFTQAPELDPEAKSSGGARAVSYQIVRHGLLADSDTAMPRYQLFRADVSDENTLRAGFNHIPMKTTGINFDNFPLESIYGEKSTQIGYRSAETIHNPIIQNADTISPTAFSIAANVVDFGIRAYVFKNNRHGTGYLKQIFPDKNSATDTEYEFLASSHPGYRKDQSDPDMNAFPHVVDIMVRILTSEGASALASFERGAFPTPSNFDGDDAAYWWEIVEKNSEVFTRRIRIFANGI